jgi:para-nitrobenzyl esterase
MGTTAERDTLMTAAFGTNLAKARALYRLDQPAPPPDPRLGTRDEQIATDVIFRCPTARFASIMAAKGVPVWQYEFDASEDGGKTAHAAEIPYAFGDATFDHGLSLKPYWLNFIRSGDPNGNGLPHWPHYTSAAPTHVLFSDSGVIPSGPLRPQICSLTEQI